MNFCNLYVEQSHIFVIVLLWKSLHFYNKSIAISLPRIITLVMIDLKLFFITLFVETWNDKLSFLSHLIYLKIYPIKHSLIPLMFIKDLCDQNLLLGLLNICKFKHLNNIKNSDLPANGSSNRIWICWQVKAKHIMRLEPQRQ
jgi:hypothetical protein